MSVEPLSVDVKDILVAGGIGVFASQSDWGIYISTMPDSPFNCVAIYDVGSSVSNRVLATKEVEEKLACSVLVRSTEYLAGTDKCADIGVVMDAINGYTGVSRNYRTFKRLQNFVPLPKDEHKRFLFSIDFVVTEDT